MAGHNVNYDKSKFQIYTCLQKQYVKIKMRKYRAKSQTWRQEWGGSGEEKSQNNRQIRKYICNSIQSW